MMHRSKIGVFLLAASILVGCRQDECDDPVPSLSFKEFTRANNDSLILTYNFRDCDGDIGLENDEIQPPYDTGSIFHYNYRINIYYLYRGVWKQYQFDEGAVGLQSRITPLQEGTQEKVVEGEIDQYIRIAELPTFQVIIPPDIEVEVFDTIRFAAVLVDRSLNESAEALSPALKIPSD